MRITISGHTDSVGTARYNQMLSVKRAQSVKEYVVKMGGIAPERVEAKGYGSSRPAASNDSVTHPR